MKFVCPLYAVADVEVSRAFYQQLLAQKVQMDLGDNLLFEGGFALQQNFSTLAGFDAAREQKGAHNGELVFEVADFDGFIARLRARDEIEYVHDVKLYPWGQRVVRFYDPDGHIVEVGESMAAIVRRLCSEGISQEEVAVRIGHPIQFVQYAMAQEDEYDD